MIRILIR